MKRFRSRFERIQHVRQQQERLARIDASLRNADVARAEADSDSVQQQLDAAVLSTDSLVRSTPAAELLRAVHAQCDRGTESLKDAAIRINHALVAHEAALAEFEIARNNARIVEKLVDGERNRHKRDVRRIEEADALERATQQYSSRIQQTNGRSS